ncbi:efflux RND transporter periplasmic adaptor subunit [Planctobacterium marinum]|uniref:efflux RND transporter periplasmic adaptor subunit n=1 Tax=Planctobacterium marinum TaxID=1631968 RepID=UPI001E5198F7|nr:efflux RND transporter periplasmic adaptor subunit [Planctobacterium marinum]MCC2608069.1 efflux RND transporter periplasmic adaptor subunit [Planctobacterium marinum]
MSRLLPLLCLLVSVSNVAQVQEVSVVYPESVVNQQTLQLTGTIEAIQDASIAVQQAGLVASLYKDMGDSVEKGEKLLQLDASLAEFQLQELQAAVKTAEVQLAEAQRVYREALRLSKTQFVPETLIAERKSRVSEVETSLLRANASLSLQQEVLKRHTVYAPFSGVITTRNADFGEWVQPQTAIFNLVSNTQLRLKVAVPQEHYGAIAALLASGKATVRVTADNAQAQTMQLPISAIVPVSDPQTRTFNMLVDVSADQHLIAGMSATMRLDLSAHAEPLLWLPKSAIKSHPDGGNSVFSVQDNKTVRHIVKIKQRDRDRVAVSGAPADVPYINKGVQLLQENTQVSMQQSGDAE